MSDSIDGTVQNATAMPAPQSPVCSTCRWWAVTSSPRGQCRRYPPGHVPWHRTASEIGQFPTTLQDYWCGEHPVWTDR